MKPLAPATLRRTALVLALAACAPVAAQDHASGWIGKIVPPYPDGVVEASGTCIGEPSQGAAHLCDTSVAVLDDRQSHLRSIVRLVQVPHFGKQALWKITDALEPGELDDREVQVAAATCQDAGHDDPSLLALVRPAASDEWLVPLRAWRPDAGGRWQALAIQGLRCRNEGFGYDG